MSVAVEFNQVSKAFGTVKAADRVDLIIEDGEFFSMLGPSGSGKTTCLRLIAGFETSDSGHIMLHGVDVSSLPPHARDRGLVKMTARSTLVAVEAGRTVRYEGPIGPFWSVDTLNFRPSRLGTQITFHNQTGTPTWMRPFHPLLNAFFQRQANRAVNGALDYVAAHLEDPESA